jgi:hypothetical protein
MAPPRNEAGAELVGLPSGLSTATPSAPVDAEAATEELDEIVRGVVDILRGLCAVLIGRGVTEADTLQADLGRIADLWRNNGRASRALPAEILVEALKEMGPAKQKTRPNIFPVPPAGTN